MKQKFKILACLLIGLALSLSSLSAVDPTEMSDANTALTYTAAEAQVYCQALTQDSNTDWVIPSAQEAMIFAGDSNDSAYVWTDTIGDFEDGGNINNPSLGNWITLRLADGDIQNARAAATLQARCIR